MDEFPTRQLNLTNRQLAILGALVELVLDQQLSGHVPGAEVLQARRLLASVQVAELEALSARLGDALAYRWATAEDPSEPTSPRNSAPTKRIPLGRRQ